MIGMLLFLPFRAPGSLSTEHEVFPRRYSITYRGQNPMLFVPTLRPPLSTKKQQRYVCFCCTIFGSFVISANASGVGVYHLYRVQCSNAKLVSDALWNCAKNLQDADKNVAKGVPPKLGGGGGVVMCTTRMVWNECSFVKWFLGLMYRVETERIRHRC